MAEISSSAATLLDFYHNTPAHLAVDNAPARGNNFLKPDFVRHGRDFFAVEVGL